VASASLEASPPAVSCLETLPRPGLLRIVKLVLRAWTEL
jgi:hypothetical protein